MFKKAALLAAALSVSACATPYRQPLDQATSTKLASATVYTRADDRGVGVQYFAQDSSAAGAPYGLLGALVSAAVDAALNWGPMDIAQNGADKLAPTFKHDQVTADLTSTLQAELATMSLFNPSPAITPLDAERKWELSAFTEDALLLTSVEYTLTQDFRSLDVVLTATAFSREAAGPTQAKSKSKSKPNKDAGRVYRNRLEYHSQPLAPFQEKTQEEIDAEIAQIKAKYLTNRRNDRQLAAMRKEMQEARRKAPPGVKAEHYLTQWLADDAALLRQELKAGVATVTDLLAMDLQDPVPFDTKAKQGPKTIIKNDGERVLVRINTLPFRGALSSEPAAYVRPLSNGVLYFRKPKAEDATAKSGAK